MTDEPIDVGRRKQLFIDDRFVADSAGVDLVMNPAQVRDEPVLVADRPWEASIAAYNTVIEDGGRYRMWYDFIPPEDDPSGITRGVAYAESTDGVHWDKPEIGLVEIGGSKANSVVIPRLPDAPRGETGGRYRAARSEPGLPSRRAVQVLDEDPGHTGRGRGPRHGRPVLADVLRRRHLLERLPEGHRDRPLRHPERPAPGTTASANTSATDAPATR